MAEFKVRSQRVSFTHTDKVYFPDPGITKGEFIEYHDRIADVMLPHMEGRPLSMHRFPDGIDGGDFFQQNASDYFPEWIDTAEVPKREGGIARHVVCNTKDTLLYLANQGCITPHIWLSRVDHLERPDRMIYDLDPPHDEEGFELAVKAAKLIRKKLEERYSFVPFVMTTGSAGLHVIVPIHPDLDFDTIRERAVELAEDIARDNPGFATTEIRKEKRKGKVFLDTVRNSYGQTTVAPYSVRPLPGAPVATPLSWDELDKPGLTPRSYTIGNIFRRLAQKEDPWKDFDRKRRGF